jgi:hypothetical protein
MGKCGWETTPSCGHPSKGGELTSYVYNNGFIRGKITNCVYKNGFVGG